MIFAPAILRAILRGEVTQVRRPHRTGEPYYRQSRRLKSTSSRVLVKPPRFREGDRFPVQQRVTVGGKQSAETHGHAIISSVDVQRAGELTYEDARQMGYRTTSDAMAAWLSDHDQAWVCEPKHSEECQACGSPLEEAQGGFCLCCGCDDQARARFVRRHADRDVWVIRFALDPSQPFRLLSAVPGREGDADGDYVTSPSQAPGGDGDPGEAVDEAEQKSITEQAGTELAHWKAIEAAHRDAELERLSLGERLDRALREANAEGRSTSTHVRVIEKRLQALERQQTRRAA